MIEDQSTDTQLPEKETFIKEVLKDYRTCCISREASLLARREVLTGKAKFGIIGDGKELPQVCMARVFQKGDFRSGYYRDQTFMFATELSSVEDFFAQLYADADNDPFSGGRQMNSHFATALIDENGDWTEHKSLLNITSDISCTGGQMARALGIALASKKYRESEELKEGTPFSQEGNEISFCTIGDASTSEGVFWETINAAGVMQVPLLVMVWDDGYGISVPTEYQTTKGSISEVLKGFKSKKKGEGIEIYTVKAWDYPSLMETFEEATQKMRESHKPALIHVQEVTQPQGHSTSGSHERYKSKERLQWEKDFDCIQRMKEWIIASNLATEEELNEIAKEAKTFVRKAKANAWNNYYNPVKKDKEFLLSLFENLYQETQSESVLNIGNNLKSKIDPLLADITASARQMIFAIKMHSSESATELKNWYKKVKNIAKERYETHLYSEDKYAAIQMPIIAPSYSDDSPRKNGFEILNTFFDIKLNEIPELFAFGEDVGQIGGVNQGFAGMQEKYGVEKVFDTGIREWTIMGQAIGMSMRGLRPIAEIQYLDYLLYGLEPLSDDLATIRYRSKGLQAAPAIIRTRGHRLEGIWHAGSPMGMLITSLRGMYIGVPRNMTQAVGMYNTLLMSREPGLIIECLNGYRLKELLPDNIGEYTVPFGVPEIIREGKDITILSYGSCIRIVMKAAERLEEYGIDCQVIDAQTLLPFDMEHRVVSALEKTNRLLVVDEDVPGGASAFLVQQIVEIQGGFKYLDCAPHTLTAKAHRPPYGSDGDYFSKPNEEDVFEKVYEIMHEAMPNDFPL